jgi:hypothetical protein
VDNSYKWAGGGFLSNVQDLVKFGNAMLFSYQRKTDKAQQPIGRDSGNSSGAQKQTPSTADSTDSDARPDAGEQSGAGGSTQQTCYNVSQVRLIKTKGILRVRINRSVVIWVRGIV